MVPVEEVDTAADGLVSAPQDTPSADYTAASDMVHLSQIQLGNDTREEVARQAVAAAVGISAVADTAAVGFAAAGAAALAAAVAGDIAGSSHSRGMGDSTSLARCSQGSKCSRARIAGSRADSCTLTIVSSPPIGLGLFREGEAEKKR